jgi:hypothetical protein
VDVYVPACGGSVRLLDFSPICSTTSPLLFSWDELPYPHMHTAAAQQQQDTSTASPADSSSKAHSQQQQQQRIGGVQAAAAGSADAVELRVVQHAGMIMPGARAATGMPIDMLGLQDSFDDVMRTMQQQQRQQQQQQQ